MNTLKEIGVLIKQRRTFLNLKQDDLSEMSNVSNKTIQQIEMGKANPSVKVLSKILYVLGMEVGISIKKPEIDQ